MATNATVCRSNFISPTPFRPSGRPAYSADQDRGKATYVQAGEAVRETRGWARASTSRGPAVRAAGFVGAEGKATKRIYDLRHTFATFAIHALVPSFIIARVMGTSEAMLRKHYGHLLPDTDELVRECLNAYNRGDEREREERLV